MKGRGDVPLRPSCAVITLRHRRFPSHRKSRIYFSVPNLRIISSRGRSRISSEGLCHEICDFFFFTRKVTDVHVRFISRDCELYLHTESHGFPRKVYVTRLRIFLFHTAGNGCQRKSSERKVRDLPRHSVWKEKETPEHPLPVFDDKGEEINSLTREQLRFVFPSECHCVVWALSAWSSVVALLLVHDFIPDSV